jgi:beta-lactamase regulating signal transducer with metallopeptidase domain
MASFIDHPYAQALAWALLHFLWQGTLLGLLAFAAMRAFGRSSSMKYAIGVIALAAMLATPVATGLYILQSDSGAAAGAAGASLSEHRASNTAIALSGSSPARPEHSAAWGVDRGVWTFSLLLIWFAGVSALSLRLLRSWIAARRLATRAVRPVTPDVQVLARRVAARLALDRIVRVLESSAVAVPVMVGWLKPVVLLPTAALSGLTPAQVEALLAHELAHVSRHDYLINLMQTAVETLLFYHPAVWWVSREVRAEREHCCDDVAVSVSDRLVYATALAELAAMNAAPRLALAATDGSLVRRVRRILGGAANVGEQEGEMRSGWFGVLIIVLSVGLVVPVALASKRASGQVAAAPGQGGVSAGVAGAPGNGPVATTQTSPGVPGGVAAGVSPGVATLREVAPEPQQARTVEDLQRLEEQMAEQQRVMRQDIEKRRLEIERAQHELEMQSRISEVEAEMQMLQVKHQEARKLFETGMINRSTLAEVEAQIALAQRKLMTAKRESEIRKAALELRKLEVERLGDLDKQQLELELAKRGLARAEQGRASFERATAEQQQVAAEVRALAARLRQLQSENELRPERLRRLGLEGRGELGEPLPSSQTIDADMILMVDISGEPDLPREYAVNRETGNIRLPLLGSIRVVGRTGAQVQEDIRKLLVDRRLGEKPDVEVVVRRRVRQ